MNGKPAIPTESQMICSKCGVTPRPDDCGVCSYCGKQRKIPSGMGAASFAAAAGDGRIKPLQQPKAGPAEAPLIAGNVPARGQP